MLLEAPFVTNGDIRDVLNPASTSSRTMFAMYFARREISSGALVPAEQRATVGRRLLWFASANTGPALARALAGEEGGRVWSVLNLDAARAARRSNHSAARAFARAAAEIEASDAATIFLREALRPRQKWPSEWSPEAYEAAARLAASAEQTRAEVPVVGKPSGVFLGMVERIGPVTVGLDAEDGTTRTVRRDVLRRRDLDRIGAAVTLLDEDIVDGGVNTFALPAGAAPMEPPVRSDPFDLTASEAAAMSPAAADWLTQELALARRRRDA